MKKNFSSKKDIKNGIALRFQIIANQKRVFQEVTDRTHFQYIKEHHDLLKEKYSQELKNKPEVPVFLESMNQIDAISKKIFSNILDQLESEQTVDGQDPRIKKYFMVST